MKKILVPIDFSEVSENATRFAIDLAKKSKAEITLYNSFHFDFHHDYQMGGKSVLASLEEKARAATEEEMQAFVRKFDSDTISETRINTKSIVPAIKEMVTDEGYNLVVTGTKGSSGIDEILIGSNTEKIVRNAECPVISVPNEVRLKEIKKVLVPIDLGEIRPGFITQIAKLQKLFKCQLEFIWVKSSSTKLAEEKVGKELAVLFKSHGIDNYRFFIVNEINPTAGIFIEAIDSEADMVAMATHARRGIAHWLSGSMTEDTVNHLDIPVWSFKIDKSEKIIKLY